METRDRWLSRVKAHIELQRSLTGRRTLILGHSWGATVVLNMLYSLEASSPGWVEDHIATFVNIGGPLLGVPKTVSALLSGARYCDCCHMGATLLIASSEYVTDPRRGDT